MPNKQFTSTDKQVYYERFRRLCMKRLYSYQRRSSNTSNYIEVAVRGKVYLFRFSDHQFSRFHCWMPDFDVMDTDTFKSAKKFLKSFDRNITA